MMMETSRLIMTVPRERLDGSERGFDTSPATKSLGVLQGSHQLRDMKPKVRREAARALLPDRFRHLRGTAAKINGLAAANKPSRRFSRKRVPSLQAPFSSRPWDRV